MIFQMSYNKNPTFPGKKGGTRNETLFAISIYLYCLVQYFCALSFESIISSFTFTNPVT